jgi:phosphoglycolate phosphatase
VARRRNYRAVIFDLDGTLLDTLEDLADSMNAVLESLGYPPHPLASYRHFTGDGVVALAERSLPPRARSEEIVSRCVKLMKQEYDKRWAKKTRPYEGIPELLDGLEERSISINVLSNKLEKFTRLTVLKFLPRWKFQCIVGVAPSVPEKPSPEGALRIARSCGIAPANFAYLGDTNTDMRTASAAGMLPVGALWGFRSREELLESGAQEVIARPAELLKFFD